ncbi:MAG: 50S ribosomal protein L28 [Candidatus Omnitrophota bacterium]
MARECFVCGKHVMAGRSIIRRGMAKRKGGAGRKITGVSKRKFLPNLQKIRIRLGKTIKRVLVCSKCIKAGKITKA